MSMRGEHPKRVSLLKLDFHSFEIGWKEDQFCLNKILFMKRRLEITVNMCQQKLNKFIAIEKVLYTQTTRRLSMYVCVYAEFQNNQ